MIQYKEDSMLCTLKGGILMKTMWLATALALGLTVPASAAFYEDTSLYTPLPASAEAEMYVASGSARSLKAEAPHYIIESDAVYRDLSSGLVTVSREHYFYDTEAGTIEVKNLSSYVADENGPTAVAAPISLHMKIPVRAGSEEYEAALLLFQTVYGEDFPVPPEENHAPEKN